MAGSITSPKSHPIDPATLSRQSSRSSVDSEEPTRPPSRFQASVPLPLQTRAPRPRPPPPTTGQQTGASGDHEHPAEQHLRIGAQAMQAAGGHNETDCVGSGQIGADAQGAHHASAANRAQAAGAAESASPALLHARRLHTRQTGGMSATHRPSLTTEQKSSIAEAKNRFDDFANNLGLSETLVGALQAELAHVDMSLIPKQEIQLNKMPPSIGMMHECIKRATEKGLITSNDARLATCAMAMPELQCLLLKHNENAEDSLPKVIADRIDASVNRKWGVLAAALKAADMPADIEKALGNLEAVFGKKAAAETAREIHGDLNGAEAQYGQQGLHLLKCGRANAMMNYNPANKPSVA